MIVRAPAKINVHLAVGPLRPDGFHQLRTVFHAIGKYDVVTATATPGKPLSLRIDGPEHLGIPLDEDNLAWRAAVLLARSAGLKPEVSVSLHKAIPAAAGLAGGSADAAATMLACDELWRLATPAARLTMLAAQLGSDVAFGLRGRTALGTGRGERLRSVPGSAQHWVLAAADGALRTPEVYRELDRQRAAGQAAASVGDPGPALAALADGDPRRVAAALANDLQPAALALAPYLRRTLDTGIEVGALGGIVSGSGPTCVFIASDADHAARLAARLQASGTCRFAAAVIGDAPTEIVRDIVREEERPWPTW